MLKIKRLNHKHEETDALIDTNKIVAVKELKLKPTKLFDENGNEVRTEENESNYKIVLEGGTDIVVTKAVYEQLEAKLKVETL